MAKSVIEKWNAYKNSHIIPNSMYESAFNKKRRFFSITIPSEQVKKRIILPV